MRLSLLALACIACANPALGGNTLQATARNIAVHPLFSDNAVLQRGMSIPVWGTADKGGMIVVKLNGHTASSVTDDDGRWRVDLPPMKAGGPYELKIVGAQQRTITRKNVMVGDVWLCSGQSNMWWPVQRSKNAHQEITNVKHPRIRLLTVPRGSTQFPQTTVQCNWIECIPKTVRSFSAVAYFFGRELNRHQKIPIGLIHSSWGGTRAEAWTSVPVLKSNKCFSAILRRHSAAMNACPDKLGIYKIDLAAWRALGGMSRAERVRNIGLARDIFARRWASRGLNDSQWKTVSQPTPAGTVADIGGTSWFRKEVDIPSRWAGKELTLELGPISNADVTYFNGVEVGATAQETKDIWTHPRKYTIPGRIVGSGRAIIATRVLDHFGGGSFTGTEDEMYLNAGQRKEGIKLAGNWRHADELTLVQNKLHHLRPPTVPLGPGHMHMPGGLYNAMIRPLIPYAIKGVIWYQGESNADRAYQYRDLLKAMITNWRTDWRQGDFPFLIVQLANYAATPRWPQSTWAELREAQAMACELPNTGLAVTVDIGEPRNIHPKNKQDVGKRLALAARRIAYGEEIVHSGPTYRSMRIEGKNIRIALDNIGSGMATRGAETLRHFAIAGADRKFHSATAVIVGNTIVVTSNQVTKPVAVRYAWANNPAGCNLYNKEGLPAVPFRTDSWPGVTFSNR